MMDIYKSKAFKPLHSPGMIYGEKLIGEEIPISAIPEHLAETITVKGLIKDIIFHDIKSSHLLIVFQMEDKKGNILMAKMITYLKYKEDLKTNLQIGESIFLSGTIINDPIDGTHMNCIAGIKRANEFCGVQ